MRVGRLTSDDRNLIWNLRTQKGSVATHLSCGGIYLVIVLLQIFSWFWQWKNLKIGLFDEGVQKWCRLFRPPGIMIKVHDTINFAMVYDSLAARAVQYKLIKII